MIVSLQQRDRGSDSVSGSTGIVKGDGTEENLVPKASFLRGQGSNVSEEISK